MDKSDSDIVDLQEEVAAIRHKYAPDYFRNSEAVQELRDLWGVSSNDFMVPPFEKELIVKVGRCSGELSFTRTKKDFWLLGLSASSAFNGTGYAPSLGDPIGYRSYHSARLAGVKRLIGFFNEVVQDNSSSNSKANKTNALQAVVLLKAELTPQLELF